MKKIIFLFLILFMFILNVKGISGTIIIERYDIDNKERLEATLVGSKIDVYKNNGLIKVLTIDENGTAKLEGLELGMYTVEERDSIIGYNSSTYTHKVYITEYENTKVVRWGSSVIEGNLIINKYYGEEGNYKLDNEAVFEVYHGDKLIKTLKTINGVISEKLEYGTYTIKQISGVKYYNLSEEFVVKIDENKDYKYDLYTNMDEDLNSFISSKEDELLLKENELNNLEELLNQEKNNLINFKNELIEKEENLNKEKETLKQNTEEIEKLREEINVNSLNINNKTKELLKKEQEIEEEKILINKEKESLENLKNDINNSKIKLEEKNEQLLNEEDDLIKLKNALELVKNTLNLKEENLNKLELELRMKEESLNKTRDELNLLKVELLKKEKNLINMEKEINKKEIILKEKENSILKLQNKIDEENVLVVEVPNTYKKNYNKLISRFMISVGIILIILSKKKVTSY